MQIQTNTNTSADTNTNIDTNTNHLQIHWTAPDSFRLDTIKRSVKYTSYLGSGHGREPELAYCIKVQIQTQADLQIQMQTPIQIHIAR